MDNKTEVFLEYKRLLFSVAYNMLGEVAAAEDIVQDTFLKWLQVDSEGVRHPKAYLVKAVTNQSINYLESARQKREHYVGTWLPEPIINYEPNRAQVRVEFYHALSIGILVLLEKLTPQERAIFLLKEVFVYDYSELADLFEKSEDNCRQIFRRAKQNLGKDSKRFQVDLKAHEKMLKEFLSATTEGRMDSLIGLLKEEIVLYADGGGNSIQVNGQRLTAVPKPIKGIAKVSRLVMTSVSKLAFLPDLVQEIIVVNGLPSIISYSRDEPVAVVILEPMGEKILNIYIQTNPLKLLRFRRKL